MISIISINELLMIDSSKPREGEKLVRMEWSGSKNYWLDRGQSGGKSVTAYTFKADWIFSILLFQMFPWNFWHDDSGIYRGQKTCQSNTGNTRHWPETFRYRSQIWLFLTRSPDEGICECLWVHTVSISEKTCSYPNVYPASSTFSRTFQL